MADTPEAPAIGVRLLEDSDVHALYVALAEALDAPLFRLDQRLAHAPGIRCSIEVPPG